MHSGSYNRFNSGETTTFSSKVSRTSTGPKTQQRKKKDIQPCACIRRTTHKQTKKKRKAGLFLGTPFPEGPCAVTKPCPLAVGSVRTFSPTTFRSGSEDIIPAHAGETGLVDHGRAVDFSDGRRHLLSDHHLASSTLCSTQAGSTLASRYATNDGLLRGKLELQGIDVPFAPLIPYMGKDALQRCNFLCGARQHTREQHTHQHVALLACKPSLLSSTQLARRTEPIMR